MNNETHLSFTSVGDISLTDLKKLVTFIKNNFNFDFSQYAMSSFKRRVARVLQLYSISNVDELISGLVNRRELFDEFLKEITVNHTEMFRAPSFWRKLRDQVIPLLACNQPIRIWSAACSSGEEIYSLAILLQEAGVYEKARIVASDINDRVIAKAKSGTYWIRSLEVNEKNYQRFEGKMKLSDYYVTSGDNYIMNKDLLRNVSFKQFDLVMGSEFSKFDLILCRNVLISFTPELQNQVLRLFNNSLFMKGFLAVGEKETIAFCKNAEKFETFCAEERIYRKISE